MTNKKFKINSRKIEGITGGLIAGGLAGAFLVLLSPIFIQYEYIARSQLWLVASSIHMITAFMIAFICIKQGTGNGLFSGVIGVAIWVLGVILLGVVCFEGRSKYIFSTIIGSLVGYALAVLIRYLLKNQNKRGVHSRRRR